MVKRTFRWLESEDTDFASLGQHTVDVPTDSLIQKIIMWMGGAGLGITTGSTGPALHDDNVLGAIQDIKMLLGTNDTLRAYDYAADLYYKNLFKHRTPGFYDSIEGTTASTAYVCGFGLTHEFRLDPRNVNDFSALLPAFAYSSLKIKQKKMTAATVETGGSAPSWTSASEPEVKHGVHEVTFEEGDFAQGQEPEITDFAKVYETWERKDIGASNDKFPIDLPMGLMIPRIFMIHRSGSATFTSQARSDAGIGRIKVKQFSPVTRDRLEGHFLMMKSQDIEEYNIRSAFDGSYNVAGAVMVDFAEVGSLENALDGRDLKQGDIKMEVGVTLSTGNSLALVIEQLDEAP